MPKFDKIELPDLPTTISRVKRKGKKSVGWDSDPDILKRLEVVAELMLRGKNSWGIAEANKCSIATAKRDISRVRALWKQSALEKIDSLMGDSLATYTAVQAEAWTKMKSSPDKSDRYLAVILSAQEKIDKISGVGKPPDPVEVNVNIEPRDIEEIRKERWRQIEKPMIPIVKASLKTEAK